MAIITSPPPQPEPLPQATRASTQAFTLGEGPVWDPASGRLLWVDIEDGRAYAGTLGDGDAVVVDEQLQLPETVAVVVPGADGRRLLAGAQRLYRVDADGSPRAGPRIVPAGAHRRLNDGAVDPAGRFLVGTLALGEPTGAEVLVRLEDDGTLTTLDDDLALSNGLAWSADGTRMYSADTLRHAVYVRPYDPASGAVGVRDVHLRLAPDLPDGIAIDADDHLWVALWGAGEVRRYAPDATLAATLTLPAPHVSSVAFAGADMRTLVITTARDGLSDAQLQAHPDSGAIFTARVAVPGPALPAWRGAAGFDAP